MNSKWFIIAIMGAAMALSPALRAAEKGHDHGAHEEGAKPGKVPDTLPGIWHEIKEHQEHLDQIIKDKKLSEVHKVAFTIRDLAKLLPDRSKKLSADDQKKLKTYVDGVAQRAAKLDEFGDGGDQANTEKEAKSLDTLLKSIEKLYPPDALKHGQKGEAGHEHELAFVCPMKCAGSESDKPGKCPKCGMNLVEKKAEPHSEAEPHRDHTAKNGGVFGMQGDYHYELVERDSEFRVYVYDAYTKPISVKGLKGSVEVEEQPGQIKTLPLASTANDSYLATPKPKGLDSAEATLALDLPGEKLKITLPLRVTLKGRVVDVACFAKDGAASLELGHDECARACIAAGSPVGLLVGNNPRATPYLITMRGDGSAASKSANETLLSLVNKPALITGKLIERNNLKIVELTEAQAE